MATLEERLKRLSPPSDLHTLIDSFGDMSVDLHQQQQTATNERSREL